MDHSPEQATEEKRYLLQMQAGDETAFKMLYNKHSKTIYYKILMLVKVEDTADELTQQLFVKIWQKRQLLDPSQGFLLYSLKMAGNLVFDFYRKIARDQQLLQEIMERSLEVYSPIEEGIYFKESRQLILQAVDQLPPQQKKVFTLCRLEGKSYEEVSEILGISVATVSNHLQQASRKVKNRMESWDKATIVLLMTWLMIHS